MASIPGYPFDGLLILRGDDGYERHAHQYATTSYNNSKNKSENPLSPGYIFYALHEKDVQMAIRVAREGAKIPGPGGEITLIKPCALAIRTGGHQYSGASSTSGDNMVLDMSKGFHDLTWLNDDNTLVKVGVSLPLSQLNYRLRSVGRFVPHGQCAFVHLGGHCQTGGYGQFSRSFGFLTDHIMAFHVINAKGEAVDVERNSEVKEKKDLFYALSGGSPGNLGVVTHVTLKVHKDQDYCGSHGFRAQIPYSSEKLKALLDVLVEMGEENVSAGYDVVITMMSKREQVPPPFDQASIVVFAQRANRTDDQKFPDGKDPWIQKLRDIIPPVPGYVSTDSNKLHLSELSSHWLFPIDREFELPYHKRVHTTKAQASYLKDRKWTQWVCDRIDKIEVPNQKCFVVSQFAYSGGTGDSMPATMTKDDGKTALSWRDFTYLMVMDCFYTPDDDGINKAAAQRWADENSLQATGIIPHPDNVEEDEDRTVTPTFSEFEDRRLLWGSHNLDLVENSKYYYDNDAKFQRLVGIKKAQDPDGIFSANKFCVVHRPPKSTTTAEISAPLNTSMFMKAGPILHRPVLKHVEDNTAFGRQPGSFKHEE
ncbi:hypothetical protein BG005_003208 [Podila minutissima]|nr:hypothetical protein BG005_003208 [Podila minutissima]